MSEAGILDARMGGARPSSASARNGRTPGARAIVVHVQALAARLDGQAIALQELTRVLSAPQATAVAYAVRTRVADLAARGLGPAADAAAAGELAALLDALRPGS